MNDGYPNDFVPIYSDPLVVEVIFTVTQVYVDTIDNQYVQGLNFPSIVDVNTEINV